jgi:plastocyanin
MGRYGMRGRKSAGLAAQAWTIVLIAGIALVLIAGGLAAATLTSSAKGTLTQPSYSDSATSSSTSIAVSSTSSTNTSYTESTATTTSSPATGSTSTATATSTSATSTSARPGTAQIVLPADVGNNESLNFQPSEVKVVIGVNNTIVWNDLDYVQHTVQSVSVPTGAKTWNSGILNEGQTFRVVLTVPGSYKYDCSIHPDWMVGTIQVVQ